MKPIRVGLLGIGTVGGGTWDVLNRNAGEIRRRAGRAIRIARVADKDVKKARRLVGGKAQVTANARDVVRDPAIDLYTHLDANQKSKADMLLPMSLCM